MIKPNLNNAEFEALLMHIFVSVSMGIRGVVILRTSEESIVRSSYYSAMDSILPYGLWGYLLLFAAFLILVAPVSQTSRRYYILIAGNFIGAVITISMASLGFVESHMTFTPLQIGSIAFFNVVLILHGGKSLWNERKEIRLLRELNSTKLNDK